MADFLTIKVNDTAIAIRDTIKSNGTALNLTGATVLFTMKARGASTNKVDGATATISSAAAGQIRYDFVTADVDTAGAYDFEWKITLSGGKILHTPSKTLLIGAALKS